MSLAPARCATTAAQPRLHSQSPVTVLTMPQSLGVAARHRHPLHALLDAGLLVQVVPVVVVVESHVAGVRGKVRDETSCRLRLGIIHRRQQPAVYGTAEGIDNP